MKKTISINISGIIFHIEEDGFDRLKNYLESVKKYFSTYEDSKEIIEDIENRIAEIFSTKLTEENQVVTKEDVNNLIATMGDVSDFEATEEPEDFGMATDSHEEKFSSNESTSKTTSGPKKLYRDTKRKVIGGVAAGIANYFNIDALWIRLGLVFLSVSASFPFNHNFNFSVSGTLFIAYIIAMFVIPESDTLEDEKKIKKFFRNGDGKVLGGVAGGLAAYFNTDITLIRVLFVVVTLLGGSGFFIYVVLWIITPETKTISDKLEMEGNPVTLSSIESNVKKNLNEDPRGEESAIAKILLFPFRLIATIFQTLGKALGPVMMFFIEAIRIFFGLILLVVGVSAGFALIVGLGAALGVLHDANYIQISDMPFELIKDAFPPYTFLAAFFAATIPFIVLGFVGLSVISKRNVIHGNLGWGLLGLWVISVISLAATLPPIIRDFNADGEHKETITYNIDSESIHLTVNEIGMDDYDGASLRLRGHADTTYKLVKSYEAQGKNRKTAIENAQMITYDVELQDSVFVFDSNIRFNEGAKFRAQDLDMTLYMPINRPFTMDYDMRHLLNNTIYRAGYSVHDIENNTWMFTEKGLKCTTCEERTDDDTEHVKSSFYFNDDQARVLDVRNFSSIEAGDAFNIEITQDENFYVAVSGDDRDLDDLEVRVKNDKLIIDIDNLFRRRIRNNKGIRIKITMPKLTELDISGATTVIADGFETDDLEIDLGGSASLTMDVKAENMEVELSGSSDLDLTGSGERIVIDMSGASSLSAYDFDAQDMEIETSGASSAEVSVSDELDTNSSGASSIHYKGTPTLHPSTSGASSLTQED